MNFRLGGHALGHTNGRLKSAVRERAGAFFEVGQFVRLFDLGKNLRLAHHHTVETRGDGEQVAYCIVTGPFKQLVEDFVDGQIMKARQKLDDLFMRGSSLRLFRGGVEFHTIAGREQYRFGTWKRFVPAAECLTQLFGAKRKPFAHCYRRPHDANSQRLESS